MRGVFSKSCKGAIGCLQGTLGMLNGRVHAAFPETSTCAATQIQDVEHLKWH